VDLVPERERRGGVAQWLSRPQVPMDERRWDYYREIGWDQEETQQRIWSEEGFASVYHYWKPFELRLIDMAQDGRTELALSDEILDEATGILRDKFQRSPGYLRDDERQLQTVTQHVSPTELIDVVKADRTDDKVLGCAVSAGSEVIVSGDHHLLDLKWFRGIKIQKAADFLAEFQARQR
jgi:uncharacterized protein